MTRSLRAATFFIIVAGCHSPSVSTVAGHGDGSSPVPVLDAPDGAPLAPPVLNPVGPLADGGAPPPTTGRPEEGNTCAEDVKMAQQSPVDLMLLVDRSSSMSGEKWTNSTAALRAFVSDPRSTGLGVGLQFFPSAGVFDVPCASDLECGLVGGTAAAACFERRACIGPATGNKLPPSCSAPGAPPCAMGTTCMPLGRCTGDAIYCNNIGAACPGLAGTCKALGRTCAMSDFTERCDPVIYNHVAVDVADLPAALSGLTGPLGTVNPEGGTPMVAAVEGTLDYLRARQAAHPDRRAFLVLATDGLPSFCGTFVGTPLDSVVAAVTRAHAQAAPIDTYTIGVFAPNDGAAGPAAVNRIAQAGGTTKAFVLSPTSDLTQTLLATLESIRGSALPCEFTIPPTRNGGVIDYGKVNFHFHGAAGDQDVLYVSTAARCDPAKGGWYYDVDPASGKPTKVLVCDATCRGFKADATAAVSLGYGCKTRVIE
jgi:hypothetical protein